MLVVLVFTALLYYAACVQFISLEHDFSKVNRDTALSEHVKEILVRLKIFKIPIHPRVRLFYELLKKGISQHWKSTSDSIFKPDKYNDVITERAVGTTLKDVTDGTTTTMKEETRSEEESE